jgi:hypothetical protein
MVRIADGTGIPLDAPVEALSADLREPLGLDRFGAAAHTPRAGLARRGLGLLLRPAAGGLRLAAAPRSRRNRLRDTRGKR